MIDNFAKCDVFIICISLSVCFCLLLDE